MKTFKLFLKITFLFSIISCNDVNLQEIEFENSDYEATTKQIDRTFKYDLQVGHIFFTGGNEDKATEVKR